MEQRCALIVFSPPSFPAQQELAEKWLKEEQVISITMAATRNEGKKKIDKMIAEYATDCMKILNEQGLINSEMHA